jgi:glucokinase
VSGSLAIGVDVGGTKILAGVVDRDGRVLRQHERPTATASQQDLVAELTAAVDELRDDGVGAIGFGIPATIDQRAGRVIRSVNIPLDDVPLQNVMRERYGIPVGLDNDANAAAIGEWRAGAGRGVETMIMVTLGTGVGGGLILDGRPFRGTSGAGAELGHVVVEFDGPVCTCGGRGHIEAFAAGFAADRLARGAFGGSASAHELVRLAAAGDGTARELLAGLGARLGAALGSFVNVFNPELIVIGGGFGVAAWDYVIPAAEERIWLEALAPARDQVRVVAAELGTAAGLIGAGFVAFEALDGQ